MSRLLRRRVCQFLPRPPALGRPRVGARSVAVLRLCLLSVAPLSQSLRQTAIRCEALGASQDRHVHASVPAALVAPCLSSRALRPPASLVSPVLLLRRLLAAPRRLSRRRVLWCRLPCLPQRLQPYHYRSTLGVGRRPHVWVVRQIGDAEIRRCELTPHDARRDHGNALGHGNAVNSTPLAAASGKRRLPQPAQVNATGPAGVDDLSVPLSPRRSHRSRPSIGKGVV